MNSVAGPRMLRWARPVVTLAVAASLATGATVVAVGARPGRPVAAPTASARVTVPTFVPRTTVPPVPLAAPSLMGRLTDDATLLRNDPGTRFGTQDQLQVERDAGGSARIVLLRFTLGGRALRAGDTVVLSLTGASAGRLDLRRTGSGWKEATVRWAGRPAPSGAELRVQPLPGPAGRVEVDVTALVRAAKTRTLSLQVAAADLTGSVDSFASHEQAAAAAPRLELRPGA